MRKIRLWKFVYALCCLVYVGWVTYLGSYEFKRIDGQIRSVVNNLDPDRINTLAHEELTKECRRQQGVSTDWKEKNCSEWPSAQVEAQEEKIEQRLAEAKERYDLKLMLFSVSFVIFFLLAPPALLYLLILGIIRLKKTIKIVK